MAPARDRLLSGTLVLAVAAALLVAGARPADADTKADLAAAAEEVADLQARAEAASQRVRKAQADHDGARQRLDELSQQLADQRSAAQQSQRSLGRVARASYTTGGLDPVLYLLLAEDGEDFAAAAQDLQRVASAGVRALSDNLERQAELLELQQEVAAEESRSWRARQEADDAAEQLEGLLAEAEERQAALERTYAAELAEQRRREAEAAAAALTAAQQMFPPPSAPTAPSGPTGSESAAPPPTTPGAAAQRGTVSEQRQRIVAFALAQVGGRYVFGSDGPGSYDCSGLVSAAYAAGGVAIDSYTGTQAARARAIPMSAAQPGDLLFYFGRGAQHVAIYLGDGRMVHAVNPSRGITIDDVSQRWYTQRFTMAGRVLP